MKRAVGFFIGLIATCAGAAGPVAFQPLTQACEEALALSALPASLRSMASVYVWRVNDYEKTVSSAGGFHCIVQRNHPESIIPECVTSTGEHSILQGIMQRTKMIAAGIGAVESEEKAVEMIRNGQLAGPEGPGVNYMLSAYNRIYSANTGEIRHFPPHSMFFAPDASSEVVGGSYELAMDNKGFPFVVEAGSHSYIVTITEKSSESTDVEKHCRGQIDTESRFK